MKPRIWNSNGSYTVLTGNGKLYLVTGKNVKPCGTANEAYKGVGRLLHSIPNNIKSIFFQLQSK